MFRKGNRIISFAVLIVFIFGILGQTTFAANNKVNTIKNQKELLQITIAATDSGKETNAKIYDLQGLQLYSQAFDNVKSVNQSVYESVYNPVNGDVSKIVEEDCDKEFKDAMKEHKNLFDPSKKIEKVEELLGQFENEINTQYMNPHFNSSDKLFEIKQKLTTYAYVFVVSGKCSDETVTLFANSLKNFFIADKIICNYNITDIKNIVKNIKDPKLKIKTALLQTTAQLMLNLADKHLKKGLAIPPSVEYRISHLQYLEALKLNKIVYKRTTGVELDKTDVTLNEGDSIKLTAKVMPEDAYNKNIIWSSSDESIATVTQDGKVLTVKDGTATVTVTTEDGSFKAQCKVEVINPLEAPIVKIEKQNGLFVLSWVNARPSINYIVQRKIEQGSYERLLEGLGINVFTDSGLNTYGIYTYKVTATNTKGETKESNEVYAYVSEMENGLLQIDNTKIDTDGDGLTDFLETNKYHTDINKLDTDGDGINDGDEVFKLFTDPTKIDTNGNGATDDKEDFDSDGIKNADEIAKKTDPWSADSDLDGLTDYQEIYTYNTDANKEDTDGDGLSDNNEVLHGTNPLVADTDNDGIKDGDEVFNVIMVVSNSEKDTKIEPSVTMDLEGKNIGRVTISNVGQSNPYLQSNIPGYIGAPYEFFAPMAFNSAKMKFKFDKELLNQQGFEPAIYYFNEQTKLLELLPNQTVDLVECAVSAEVNHFSTYILLNKKSVDEFWAKEMKAPFEGEIENIELVIGFAIDSSESMSWNDPSGLRKQTAKEFVDKMDENDKASVIDFDSTAKVNCSLTSDKAVIKTAIDRIDSSGGTDLGAGVRAALAQLQTSTSKAKYIIMLTDGEGAYDNNLTQQAISQGVKIYTIGLGSSIDVNLLTNIAAATGGKYYHASTASDLSGVFEQTSGETVDLTKDTDGDGLSDYHEKRGVRVNTDWIDTEYDNADTDGDGLKDGVELSYKNGYFVMNTDLTKKDSDNDGINDNADPEPMVYSITDRTLALSAFLSYSNLESSIGSLVGNKGESELSNFNIIYANNSGSDSLIDNIVEGFMDNGLGSVAIKISRSGKRDAVILSYRGTEFDDDAINDGGTDLIAAALTYNPQASWVFNDANKEYRKLIKEYPNADFYLSGHSLGGRVMQDVLFSVLDDNIGWFSKEVKKPVHCATFNAFGYNKVDFYANKLIQGDVFTAAEGLLNNYYYQYDLVGNGLGASALFKRIGTDIGPWTAKDENGNVIEKNQWIPYEPAKLHGVTLFFKDVGLKYPSCSIY